MSKAPMPWNQTCVDTVDPDEREDHVRYCSPFAARLIDRHPEWLEQLQAAERLDEPSPPHPVRAREWVAAYGLDDGLRAFRNQEMLRIAWRDLCGLATLGEVLADLTGLATICLAHAVDKHHEALREKHGTPLDDSGAPQAPVVIGLGKLGGGELNFSSDIDIVFCFPAGGQCDGPKALSNQEYFARHARAVIATLGDVRASGICFRVDTRLRPFGQAGPIACSFPALEQYYQREGRDWERYALVKAWPVAGDLHAGECLIEALRPFVYRRYIDFGAIEALREMQALIRSETAREDLQDDIKRGPGGIREVEFLAQGFQLLRGGRERRLQTPRLFEALEAIADLALLPRAEVERLQDDYTWLRQVENRLQAMRDQQTCRLPGEGDLQRLRQGIGLHEAEAFDRRLSSVRRNVSRLFDETWAGDTPATPADEDSNDLAYWRQRWADWRDDTQESESPAVDSLDAGMRSFLAGLSRRPSGERAARRLDRFMPMLLQRLGALDPDKQTVTRLLDLVQVITKRSAYLALLAENPGALDRMVELFSRSAWVAGSVARFPELLDELIDPELGQHIPDRDALQDAVSRKLELRDEESALAGLNYLKQAACLRLAVAWLENRMDEEALQLSLSTLAELMIDATMRLAWQELDRRHGTVPGAEVAVIGYGSLGARELAFGSDLDLVFLYRKGEGESDGKRPLAAERWFARLAQRMVGLLTALTPSGKLYDIDTRLRPNGQSGLLVSGIDAFESYQKEAAWTWEAQALTRARAVAGNEDLCAQFEDIRIECLCRERDRATLSRDLVDMRERIRKSHGSGSSEEDRIKHGTGGLVDIGFIAQLGVLSTAAGDRRVARPTGASEQLECLLEVDWLDSEQHRLLRQHLRCLRRRRTAFELDAPEPEKAEGPGDEAGQAVADLFSTLAGMTTDPKGSVE